MDQNASSDYYIVASARFVNESLWTRVTGVAILHYSNSMGKATGPLPKPPDDYYYKAFSMNQARFIRFVLSIFTNLHASIINISIYSITTYRSTLLVRSSELN